ncbi:hypothetical protein BLOT_001185 [Blomia tropicalis]|nr:hypothetical protein BLOT_001185 [Blomia tropicalis]
MFDVVDCQSYNRHEYFGAILLFGVDTFELIYDTSSISILGSNRDPNNFFILSHCAIFIADNLQL